MDFASILIQINSTRARYAETDARNGGIYDNLYSTTNNPDLKKKIILRTVWATNKWSTPSDRARRVALEKLSRRSRCQLCLVRSVHQKRTERNLFQKSKCHFFKKKKRSRKIGTRSKRDWPVRLRMRSRKTGTFFFLKKRAFTFLERVPFRSFLWTFFTGM